MLRLVLIPLVVQILIPVALLGWLGFARVTNVGTWLMKVMVVAWYLSVLGAAQSWMIVPRTIMVFYLVWLLGAAWNSGSRLAVSFIAHR